MTEDEWLTSDDPAKMLRMYTSDDMPWPRGHLAPIVSDRKLRLFACACCRSVWGLLTDERSRKAVEVAERYADGEASLEDVTQAQNDIDAAFMESDMDSGVLMASWTLRSPSEAARRLAGCDIVPPAARATLLRDIVGNPFRPVAIWNVILDGIKGGQKIGTCVSDHVLTDTVLSLAQAAYDNRDPAGRLEWDRLAVLSDALEEAGCPSEVECPTCSPYGYPGRITFDGGFQWGDCAACGGTGKALHPLLAALRSPGPHYRGFWALDLLRGVE